MDLKKYKRDLHNLRGQFNELKSPFHKQCVCKGNKQIQQAMECSIVC